MPNDDVSAEWLRGARSAVVDDAAHRQRLETLGHMVATLVHELNGPLCALLLNLEWLDQSLTGEPRQVTRTAIVEAKFLRDLIGDFLSYARGPVRQCETVDLRETIDTVVRISAPYVGARADLAVRSDALPEVLASRTALIQVLLNVVLNAADAFPPLGSSKGLITIAATVEDERVIVEVRDNGSGIPPDVLPHVFEPYFTTKSGGTGLGLATVRAIIKNLGGDVTIGSAPAKGTAVKITLRRGDPPR